jgi:hypothetical protein
MHTKDSDNVKVDLLGLNKKDAEELRTNRKRSVKVVSQLFTRDI